MTADDRTPDTREVRSMYVAGSNLYRETPEQHYLGAPVPDYGAEFDRWLAAHDARVEHRATRAEAQSEARRVDIEYWQGVARGNAVTVDVWKETALQERAAALDALEQIKARDARIKAVQDVLDRHKADGLNPYALDVAIRRALDGDA